MPAHRIIPPTPLTDQVAMFKYDLLVLVLTLNKGCVRRLRGEQGSQHARGSQNCRRRKDQIENRLDHSSGIFCWAVVSLTHSGELDASQKRAVIPHRLPQQEICPAFSDPLYISSALGGASDRNRRVGSGKSLVAGSYLGNWKAAARCPCPALHLHTPPCPLPRGHNQFQSCVN
jgi:hypothetical protein